MQNRTQQSLQTKRTATEPFSLDLHRVEEALRTNHKLFGGTPLTAAEIIKSVAAYRLFLQQHKAAGMPDNFEKPTLAVDRVWHTHMCETEQYRDDCMRYFGKIFEHSNGTCDMKIENAA